MSGDPQELKWLETQDYPSWGTHVARSMERKHPEPHDLYSLSGAAAGTLNGHIVVLVGGREELPSQCFTSVARLDLFDLTTSKWLTDYDMQGALTHRIGHSVVTVQGKAYAFGGEQLVDCAGGVDNEWPQQLLLGDVYELSYADSILRCDEISPMCGDGNDPNVPPVAAPSERAWHASAAVCFPEATSSAESPHTQGVLVLGGKDAHGVILSDVWLLPLNIADQKSRWTQLTPTGNSPLPLAFHSATTISEGDKIVVLGGKQSSNPLAVAMNAGIHVLDLTTNSWSTVMIAGEAASPITHALTARCCATVLTMQLPIDDATGMLRRIKAGEEPCEPQEAVVIFGGFSEYEPALSPSSMLVLEVNHSRLREVQMPSARLKSYMAHATVVCPGRRAFLVFGGAPTPAHGESDMTPHQFLDTTMALDFWKTPADFPSEVEEEAAREAAQNPIKTKTLSNGDVYVGEINQAQTQRHGKGKCSYANGGEYDGDWRDDQRCGQGVMRYASSQDVYAGQWERDQRHGYGIYEHNTPQTHVNDRQKTLLSSMQQRQPKKYEGQWVNDAKHGSGTLTFSDGSQLVGSWANDVLDTREKSRLGGYDDGQHGPCSYVGEVLDGVPHGRGESHHEATGDVYVGSWMAGHRSGHGVVTLRDGSVYRGEWRNGRRNGFGVFDDVRTRARYDGKWVGDVRCGRGVCTYANGCSYEGDWQDDARHGAGRYLFADGSCFDGAWQSDSFCGDGSFVLCIDNGASASVLQPDANDQE